MREPPDPRREQLIPVVSYAVERRLASGEADYWNHATRLELAVLAKDEETAIRALASALAMVRENWEPESTASNLKLIRSARKHRNDDVPWAETIERELPRKAGQPRPAQAAPRKGRRGARQVRTRSCCTARRKVARS